MKIAGTICDVRAGEGHEPTPEELEERYLAAYFERLEEEWASAAAPTLRSDMGVCP